MTRANMGCPEAGIKPTIPRELRLKRENFNGQTKLLI